MDPFSLQFQRRSVLLAVVLLLCLCLGLWSWLGEPEDRISPTPSGGEMVPIEPDANGSSRPGLKGADSPQVTDSDKPPTPAALTVRISGAVRRSDGQAAGDGVHVTARLGERSHVLGSAHTDQTGRFEIEFPLLSSDGAPYLCLLARMDASKEASLPHLVPWVRWHGGCEASIVLLKAGAVTARVVDATGRPVRNAVVLCRNSGPGRVRAGQADASLSTHQEFTSDASGKVMFAQRYGRIELYARSPDGAFGAPTSRRELSVGATLDFGDVRAGGAAVPLRLRVVDAQGGPVAGAWVGFDYPLTHLVGLQPLPDAAASDLPDAEWHDAVGSSVYLRAKMDGTLRLHGLSRGLGSLDLAIGSARHQVVSVLVDLSGGGSIERTVVLSERPSRRLRLLLDSQPAKVFPFRATLRAATISTRSELPAESSGAARRMREDVGGPYVAELPANEEFTLYASTPSIVLVRATVSGGTVARARVEVRASQSQSPVALTVPDGRVVELLFHVGSLGPELGDAALGSLAVSSVSPSATQGPDGAETDRGEHPSVRYRWTDVASTSSVSVWVPWGVQALSVSALTPAHLPVSPIFFPIPDSGRVRLTAAALLGGSGTLVVREVGSTPGSETSRAVMKIRRLDPGEGYGRRARAQRSVRIRTGGGLQVPLPPGKYRVSSKTALGGTAWVDVEINGGQRVQVSTADLMTGPR